MSRDASLAEPVPTGYDEAVVREALVSGIRTHAESAEAYWSLIMNLGIGGFFSSLTAGTVVLASFGIATAAYTGSFLLLFAVLWYLGFKGRETFVERVAVCDGRLKMLEELIEKFRRVRTEHREQLDKEVLEGLEEELPRLSSLVRDEFSLTAAPKSMRNPDPYASWPLGKAVVDDWGYNMSFYNPSPGRSIYTERRLGLWRDAALHYPKLSELADLERDLKWFNEGLARLERAIKGIVPDERVVEPSWGLEAAKQIFAIWLLTERVLKNPSHNYSFSARLQEEAVKLVQSKVDVAKARTLAREIGDLALSIDTRSRDILEAVRIYRCYPTVDEDCPFTRAPELRKLVDSIAKGRAA